mmetsp:Transcript_16179/g.23790  ORF Transcript_16179/g.23790 Transcript_16179/m.23790 type:complete len:193 (+) Transcript_16179:133-711(+)
MAPCGQHGFMYSVATFLFMIGNILSWAASWYCKFTERYVNGEHKGNYGVWLIESKSSETCFLIDPNDPLGTAIWYSDPALGAARGSSTASNTIAFFSWVVLWCGLCCGCSNSKCFRMVFGFLAWVCAALTGMLFLILNSSYPCGDYYNTGNVVECKIATGGVLAIVSIICFFLAGVLHCICPDPLPNEAFFG